MIGVSLRLVPFVWLAVASDATNISHQRTTTTTTIDIAHVTQPSTRTKKVITLPKSTTGLTLGTVPDAQYIPHRSTKHVKEGTQGPPPRKRTETIHLTSDVKGVQKGSMLAVSRSSRFNAVPTSLEMSPSIDNNPITYAVKPQDCMSPSPSPHKNTAESISTKNSRSDRLWDIFESAQKDYENAKNEFNGTRVYPPLITEGMYCNLVAHTVDMNGTHSRLCNDYAEEVVVLYESVKLHEEFPASIYSEWKEFKAFVEQVCMVQGHFGGDEDCHVKGVTLNDDVLNCLLRIN